MPLSILLIVVGVLLMVLTAGPFYVIGVVLTAFGLGLLLADLLSVRRVP
jgi:hypothetical protein